MSSGYRDDRPALVALGLILAAIVLVSALGLLVRYQPIYQQSDSNISSILHEDGQRGPSEGHWWPEFSARDTYAQWAMTGLAFVATIISIVSVFLIRQTFIETKRTADAAVASERTAREMGQRQLRAYLSVHEMNVISFGVGHKTRIEAVFINTGQTPARNIRLAFQAAGATDLKTAKFPAGRLKLSGESGRFELGAGEKYTAAVTGIAALDQEGEAGFRNSQYFQIVGAQLRYADVFGVKHRLIARGHLSFHPNGEAFINVSDKSNRGN